MLKSQPDSHGKKSSSQKSDEAFIQNPINIARARYASTYGESVVDKKEQVSAILDKQSGRQAKAQKSSNASSFSGINLNSQNGCIIAALLSVAFVIGGILGGVAGGSLLLWLTSSQESMAAADFSTPTSVPTPTPAPVEQPTSTPTPEPEPVTTPSVEDVISAVLPSVVTIINQQNGIFFSRNSRDDGRVVGSGVVVDPRGYIATNNHVVDASGELSVILADGREMAAELIAANPAEDLAIVKIDASGLQPIQWGASGKVRPGQIVYAIGSPLGDFPNSVSFGIISGVNRALEIDKFVIDGLLQTDAAINRGSSGGPLIDIHGKVIGINTFIIRESEERGVAEGIAFSIPSDSAKNLLIPWIAAHTGESVPIPVSEESN